MRSLLRRDDVVVECLVVHMKIVLEQSWKQGRDHGVIQSGAQWSRCKKMLLIRSFNPEMEFLTHCSLNVHIYVRSLLRRDDVVVECLAVHTKVVLEESWKQGHDHYVIQSGTQWNEGSHETRIYIVNYLF